MIGLGLTVSMAVLLVYVMLDNQNLESENKRLKEDLKYWELNYMRNKEGGT